MKKTVFILLGIVMLTGCNKKNKTENETPIPQVKFATVSLLQSEGVFHYSGTVEAFQSIPLSFRMSGTVLETYVEEGDAVGKGQVLAILDKSDAENMYAIASSKYEQAQDAYQRLKEVYDQGSLTEIKWVEMQTNLQQAKSSADMAKNNLDKCVLRSPDSGIIGRKNVEPGMSALANPVAPFELVKINDVYVKIAVSENEISKIKKDQKASIRVSALDDGLFKGVVSHVGVVADPISRTYEVKILVHNNKTLDLKPGMVCDVNLEVKENRMILSVPFQAVDEDMAGDTYVYVLDSASETVIKRIVQVGHYNNNNIEILSGLQEGEQVVVAGKHKLSDRTQIKD